MALKLSGSNRKGFIYTLEAVIAATLFLTTVTMLIPQGADPADTRPVKETVRSAIESLDRSGDLRDDLTVAALEAELDPFVPTGYNHSVRVTEVETENRKLNSPQEFYFDKQGEGAELQLWLHEASNLEATFDGETVIQDRDSVGYVQEPLPGTEGYLNFTGTGKGSFDFDVYHQKGGLPESDSTRSLSYVVAEENLTEIKVFLWTE